MSPGFRGKKLFVFPVVLALLGFLPYGGPSLTYVPLNGTFSGGIVVPAGISDEVVEYLSGFNTTPYSFEAEVLGDDMNASIILSVLRLSPPYEPEDFEVIINARQIKGTTYVPYAERIPVCIRYHDHDYRAFLTVKARDEVKASGSWSRGYLDGASNSTLLEIGDLRLVVRVEEPGYYFFSIVTARKNAEVNSGGLILGVGE
ncbi:hypothetical protein APY94_05250 [Thermococcus celericrescens]|uniref:Uncharacterized protein n=1 Tax=Thermococcus celericrescens TaxID=227598 RepID=A0A117ITR2_9EURY|nr:hypothetical protein [Thermococcus celericrescens]KUH33601.1 hypothetical protein APY94_05250 [Thermococcus celericrescens]